MFHYILAAVMGIAGIASGMVAPMSLMAFDAPDSTKKWVPYLFVITMLTLPLTLVGGGIGLAWSGSYWWSATPLFNVAMFGLVIVVNNATHVPEMPSNVSMPPGAPVAKGWRSRFVR